MHTWDFSTNALQGTWDFFDAKGQWLRRTKLGPFSLLIPIWSSGQRKLRWTRLKVNLDKIKVVEDKTSVALNLQVETSRNDFVNSYNVFINNKKSLETA